MSEKLILAFFPRLDFESGVGCLGDGGRRVPAGHGQPGHPLPGPAQSFRHDPLHVLPSPQSVPLLLLHVASLATESAGKCKVHVLYFKPSIQSETPLPHV